MIRCAAVLCAAIIAVNVLSCGPREPRPGTVQDEAMRAGVTPETARVRRPRLLPRHGRQRAASHALASRDRGTQHVDRLDRRQRSAVGSAHGRQPRHLRSPEDDLVASAVRRLQSRLRPPQPLALPRPRQRAVLQGADRSRPEPLRALARRARSDVRAGSVRRCRASTRASGSARAARPCPSAPITASRPAVVGLRLFPNPDFDEKARQQWDSERYYNDPTYYFDREARAAVSRRHVVRVLSRRAQPDQAAGRSGERRSGRT